MPAVLSPIIFWMVVACCLVAQVAIVRASVAPMRSGVTEGGVPRPARGAELVWVILPALLLALALFWTWRAIGHEPRLEHHIHSSTLDVPSPAGRGGHT